MYTDVTVPLWYVLMIGLAGMATGLLLVIIFVRLLWYYDDRKAAKYAKADAALFDFKSEHPDVACAMRATEDKLPNSSNAAATEPNDESDMGEAQSPVQIDIDDGAEAGLVEPIIRLTSANKYKLEQLAANRHCLSMSDVALLLGTTDSYVAQWTRKGALESILLPGEDRQITAVSVLKLLRDYNIEPVDMVKPAEPAKLVEPVAPIQQPRQSEPNSNTEASTPTASNGIVLPGRFRYTVEGVDGEFGTLPKALRALGVVDEKHRSAPQWSHLPASYKRRITRVPNR